MILQSDNLKKYSRLIHGFTTRELGSDYTRIGVEIGVSAEVFKTLHQLHSDKVVGYPFLEKEGDALITDKPGILVGVRTADCVPLLAYDPRHKAVAAIHAGWKGILVGIIESSLQAMKKEFHTDPSSLIVAVGATLCPGCFEIGPEVAQDFFKKFGDRLTITPSEGGKSFIDLKKACELILTDAGVLVQNIEFYLPCNKCRENLFFSFRRGDENDRQLSFIGLKN